MFIGKLSLRSNPPSRCATPAGQECSGWRVTGGGSVDFVNLEPFCGNAKPVEWRVAILLRAMRLRWDDRKRIGLFFLTKLTKFQEFDCIKL